jgi:Piwi domain
MTKLKMFYGKQGKGNPKLGFIAVNKKTNTRIFQFDNRHGHSNPLPGSVVDNTITLKER